MVGGRFLYREIVADGRDLLAFDENDSTGHRRRLNSMRMSLLIRVTTNTLRMFLQHSAVCPEAPFPTPRQILDIF